MTKLMAAITAALLAVALAHPAEAKKLKHPRIDSQKATDCFDNSGRYLACRNSVNRFARPSLADANGNGIVAHPAGCPHRAFCGCGVSVKVFGKPVRSLFLAANWLKFPRAEPGPGMVAARRGHVFYIIAYNGNGTALAYDPNSGGRKTRIHVRSLAGYKVVNPHSRLAGL